MNEDDIRGIYWLLVRINDDMILRDYFANNLNIMGTDIVRLRNKFKDFVKMLDNPMKGDLSITMIPNIIVSKK